MPKVPQINWPNKAYISKVQTSHNYFISSNDGFNYLEDMAAKRRAKNSG